MVIPRELVGFSSPCSLDRRGIIHTPNAGGVGDNVRYSDFTSVWQSGNGDAGNERRLR